MKALNAAPAWDEVCSCKRNRKQMAILVAIKSKISEPKVKQVFNQLTLNNKLHFIAKRS